MDKKYVSCVVIVGALFIGGTWLFRDDTTTSVAQPAGSQIYQAPTDSKPPATSNGGSGDAKF